MYYFDDETADHISVEDALNIQKARINSIELTIKKFDPIYVSAVEDLTANQLKEDYNRLDSNLTNRMHKLEIAVNKVELFLREVGSVMAKLHYRIELLESKVKNDINS